MKIDSEHLELLAAIIEYGGLTEGAQALGKSQPSVSRSMALLEQRIGLPLFEPGRRPLRPTELGASLARLGAKIRAANQEASFLVDKYRLGHAGRLRVGGSPLFMDGVVSTMIADFQGRNSEVLIDQSYGYAETLTNSLRNGGLDMAILPMNIGQIPDDMNFLAALPGSNVIACRAGHPLTRRKAITLHDIEPYSWIAPPRNSPLHQDLQRALETIGCQDFRVSFSGGTLSSVQSVIAGSDALTVLPLSVVFLSRRSLPMAALPLNIGHPDRHLGLLFAKNRERSPALEKFVKFLMQELERLHIRIEHDRQVTRRRG
ncbi:LysR family transcriptional regulator [Falsigemmobacter faecalis]|uniref:LysR family transcriptional regulator n=1 Tax=Falsigemmobacter faecalis TaxID=2488730 RepID=A0A3P3D4M6_9RHOB|nr:LysR family transcriptional regulator [Falsigemmobacter faecalis]RRH69347.1 LysR family transcriptional regulator [Falsigemmobacter faecalis]